MKRKMVSSVPRLATRSNAARGFYSRFYDLVNGSGGQLTQCTSQSRTFRTHGPRQHVRRDEEEPRLSTHLREIMRKMPHSVVVATTSCTASESDLSSSETGGPPATSSSIYSSKTGSKRVFRGMTVSSFTTLTLTPTPIITFNIRKPSRTLDALRDSGQFLVHILSATEEGAQTAHGFTKGNQGDVFKGINYAVWNCGSDCPLPLLSSPGVTKVLRCKLRDEAPGGLVEVGDHVLVLADVENIIEPPPTKHRAALEDRGLSYLDRAYRSVGECIEVVDVVEEKTLEE